MRLRAVWNAVPGPGRLALKHAYGGISRCLPRRWRYGRVDWTLFDFLQESQWWPREKIEEYQMQQLRRLLRHAYENVPYYRTFFNERGLQPKDIQTVSDLNKLPYLTKEMVRDNLSDLTAKNYAASQLAYVTTGGSTGVPVGFHFERATAARREKAFVLAMWKRVGFTHGDGTIVLRGNIIPTADRGRPWLYNPLTKNLSLSSFHMTDEMLPLYISRMRASKLRYIHAFPSSVTILARFMQKNAVAPFPEIKAVLCGSENLYSWQRKLLEEVFRCRVYSWYGHSERAVLAAECEKSTDYHVFPEYGIVELVATDGRPVEKDGEAGEVVATGFVNYASPFIRYRTGDIAINRVGTCECGRQHKLLSGVEGRLQEFLITGKGRLISMANTNMHSDVFDNVAQFQFYQDTKGEVVFNLVRKASYTEADTKRIRDALMVILGQDVRLELRFVDDIPRTVAGKHKLLVQKLPIDFGDA